MNIEYHLQSIESDEKDDIRQFCDFNLHHLNFVENHCQAHQASDLALLKLLCVVSKTQEPSGHGKYQTTLHLHLPVQKTQHVHVMKQEGHNLTATLKKTWDAMVRHLKPVIDKLKEHKHHGHPLKNSIPS